MKRAYVTLVSLGDFYIPGALALAHALRTHGTTAELTCMVTQDVSRKGCASLLTVYDRLIEVPYLFAPVGKKFYTSKPWMPGT